MTFPSEALLPPSPAGLDLGLGLFRRRSRRRSPIRPSATAAVFLRRCLLTFSVTASLICLSRFTLLPFYTFSFSGVADFISPPPEDKVYSLQKVLKDAATDDHTVIITTLNEAWSAPNSIFDLFLESFRIGDHTKELLNHMIVVALDEKAFIRCLNVHGHCFALATDGADFSKEAYFMTPDYLKMMWKRIDFLRSVLELGYSFVFTDSDVMWFRNPFPHFYPDVDFQIACDHFFGNSSDLHNRPNGGFSFVRSNKRSIAFYNFWYSSESNYPGYHDQDVLNFIKRDPFITEIGLTMRFLHTAYFGGLCEPSENFNLVCTMHANCCYGMDSKLIDLKIMLQDWKQYISLPPRIKRLSTHSWRVPKNCSSRSTKVACIQVKSLNSRRYPGPSVAEEQEDDQS